MTEARRKAPHPEWVQMYRQGIPSPKIAAEAGAAESTVRYHLHLAVQAEPSIREEHKAASGTVTRNSPAGVRNMNDIIAFYKAERRLPSTHSASSRDRAMAVWLHRRRQEAVDGTISPIYKEGLSVIPDWDRPSTRKADDEAPGRSRRLPGGGQ
jgi:transposase